MLAEKIRQTPLAEHAGDPDVLAAIFQKPALDAPLLLTAFLPEPADRALSMCDEGGEGAETMKEGSKRLDTL
jgi:hypothetical protein